MVRARVRVRISVRGRVRVFGCNQGTELGAVCTAALQKEEVEDVHLGCG